MRKSRFTEERIVGILQEYAAGAKVVVSRSWWKFEGGVISG